MVTRKLWQVGSIALLGAFIAAGEQDPETPAMLEVPVFVPPADAPEYAVDRVVVKFSNRVSTTQIETTFGPLGAHWLERGEDDDFDVLRVAPGTVMDWVALLSELPGVEYAEPDYVAWATGTPNDPFFKPYQWNFLDRGLKSNGYVSNYGVQGTSAWDKSNGSYVVVAVVDSGVAYENYPGFAIAPDLSGTTFVFPRDYVSNDYHANDGFGHGTHVCGTIRQTINNGIGCAGLANKCTIMPVRVLDNSGSGYNSWIADGIRWAANHGAFIINLSLGSRTSSTTVQSAVQYASGKGCVLVAAAGNNSSSSMSYPAKYVECIAVGATRFDGARPAYSNYGSGLDVMAPGGDNSKDQNHDGYGDGILQQTFINGKTTKFDYYFFQGTSQAAPHVSAIAAMVKSRHNTYSASKVRTAIETTTKDLGTNGYDTNYGWGLVDAKAAVNY